MDRDSKGRFLPGNRICFDGWKAFVNKYFDGDEALAKRYWGDLGAHHYAQQNDGIPLKAAFAHPGTPAEYRKRFERRQTDSWHNDIEF